MKIFKIPVTWEVCGTIDIEAETLEKAIEIFDDEENNNDGYSLPLDSNYIDGSFKREDMEVCSLYNTL